MQKDYVHRLFDSIAYRYDLLNHLLSGGVDFYWRWKAIRSLRNLAPKRILDVATGTADFAIAATALQPDLIIGVDISEQMLSIGQDKVRKKALNNLIQLKIDEAENLHFSDHSFDAAIVAYGARNFEHLDVGLREMQRVLCPGGRIIVLEFSRPKKFPFKQIYFFYFLKILPWIGRVISRDNSAYQYLPDTVMNFPDGGDFLSVLRKAGFTDVQQQSMTFGISTIYMGTKPGIETRNGEQIEENNSNRP